MRTRLLAIVASSALTALVAAPAGAATVEFNPAGTGAVGALTIDLLDPSPGNSLSIGLNANSAPGSIGQLLFQANLGSASNTVGGTETQVFANGQVVGGQARFFTIAASFGEVLTANIPIPGVGQLLAFGPTGGASEGTFNIYAQTAGGSDLNGVCFVNCGAGSTLILTGTLLNNANRSGLFGANLVAGLQDLDQFGPSPCPGAGCNDYPGVQTITGSGGFKSDILITGVNAGYFPTLQVGQTLLFATTENTLPFKTANPSRCFSSDAVASCDTVGVGSVGPTNGLGNNTMLQTDANLSFGDVQAVPEPATLTLLGFGLIGAAARRRRERNAAK